MDISASQEEYKMRLERLVRKIDYTKSQFESAKKYFDIGSKVIKGVLSRDPQALDDETLEDMVTQNFGELGRDFYALVKKNYVKSVARQQVIISEGDEHD